MLYLRLIGIGRDDNGGVRMPSRSHDQPAERSRLGGKRGVTFEVWGRVNRRIGSSERLSSL